MTAMTFDQPLRPSRPRVSSPRLASPVRLTRRGRVLLLLLLVSVVLVAFSLGRNTASADGSRVPRAPRTAVVQPGETLWSIAQRVAPGTDPRLTVARLTDMNALGSAPIVAGQRLLLPG